MPTSPALGRNTTGKIKIFQHPGRRNRHLNGLGRWPVSTLSLVATTPQKQQVWNSTHRRTRLLSTSSQGLTRRPMAVGVIGRICLHIYALHHKYVRVFHFQILTAPSLLPESNVFVGSSVTLTSNTTSSWLVRGATRPFSCIDRWRWWGSNRRHDGVVRVMCDDEERGVKNNSNKYLDKSHTWSWQGCHCSGTYQLQ